MEQRNNGGTRTVYDWNNVGEYEIQQAFQDFGAGEEWIAGATTEGGMVTVGRSWSYGSSVTTMHRDTIPEQLKAHFAKFFPTKTP